MSNKKITQTWEEYFWQIANSDYDGHACIFSFTTNWIACFGTPHEELHSFFINRPMSFSKKEACRLAVDRHFNPGSYPKVVGDSCPKCQDGILISRFPDIYCDNKKCDFEIISTK